MDYPVTTADMMTAINIRLKEIAEAKKNLQSQITLLDKMESELKEQYAKLTGATP